MSDEFNIKMLKDMNGTEDGFTNIFFKKNEVYVVGESLFRSFKNMAACELVKIKEEAVKKVIKKKATPVKENKAAKPAKEEK